MNLSIKYKLLMLMALVSTLTLLLYLILATKLFMKDKIAYVFDSSATLSKNIALQVEGRITALQQKMLFEVENYDTTNKTFSRLATESFQNDADLRTFSLFEKKPEGNDYFLLAELTKLSKTQAQSSELQNQALRQAELNGESLVLLDRENDDLIYAFAIPKAKPPVLALSRARLRGFGTAFSKPQNPTFLVDQQGNIVAGPVEKEKPPISTLDAFHKVAEAKLSQISEEGTYGGAEKLITVTRIASGEFFLVSMVDRRAALKAVEYLIKKSLLLFIALVAMAIVISVFASNYLTSTLLELFSATQRIAEGKFDVKIDVRSNDEIGSLAKSFNIMSLEVERLIVATAEKARMEKELNVARLVQETLFPDKPYVSKEIEIAGSYQPASECGGDWWYYTKIGSKIFLWIGDATGHGVGAALVAGAARSAASVIDQDPNLTAGKALEVLNRAISQTSKGRILMTFFLGIVDIEKQELTYSNASHEPPFILGRGGDEPTYLNEISNPRLGDTLEHTFKEKTVPFKKGEMLFLFTDGILDLKNKTGRAYGERSLLKLLRPLHGAGISAQEIVVELNAALEAYRDGSPLEDDITYSYVNCSSNPSF